MPKILLIPTLILLLAISCGAVAPTDSSLSVQEQMKAAGVAAPCALGGAFANQAADWQLLACLNKIHEQNQEIISLLERIAANQEAGRPLEKP